MAHQGSLELLRDPVAEALVGSTNPARLAYTWMDGSPRVVPIWFHWTGDQFVLGSPPKAPKLKALAEDPRVALTIDDNTFPHKVLLVRGTARLEAVNGVVPNMPKLRSDILARNRARHGSRNLHPWSQTWCA